MAKFQLQYISSYFICCIFLCVKLLSSSSGSAIFVDAVAVSSSYNNMKQTQSGNIEVEIDTFSGLRGTTNSNKANSHSNPSLPTSSSLANFPHNPLSAPVSGIEHEENAKVLMSRYWTECYWHITYSWSETPQGLIDSNAVYWAQLLPPREQDGGHTIYRIRGRFHPARYWSFQIYEGVAGAESVNSEYKVLDEKIKQTWGKNPFNTPHTHTSENGEYDIFIHVYDDEGRYQAAVDCSDDSNEDQVIYLYVDTSFRSLPPYVIMREYEVDPVARNELGYTNPSELIRPTILAATIFNEDDKSYDVGANSVSAWQEYIYRTYLNENNYLWTQLKVCEPSGMMTNAQSEDIAVGGSMYFRTDIATSVSNLIWLFNTPLHVLRGLYRVNNGNNISNEYGCPVHQNKMVLFEGDWMPVGVRNLVARLGSDAKYGVWCDNIFEKGAQQAMMNKVIVYKFKLPTFPTRLWSDDVPAVNGIQIGDKYNYDMRYFSISTADTKFIQPTINVLTDRQIEEHYYKLHGDSWDRWTTVVIAANWDVVQNCIDNAAAHGGECLYSHDIEGALFLPWVSDRIGFPERPTIVVRNIISTSDTSLHAFSNECNQDGEGGRACGDWQYMKSVMKDYYPDMKIYMCGAHDFHPQYQDPNYNQINYLPYYESA